MALPVLLASWKAKTRQPFHILRVNWKELKEDSSFEERVINRDSYRFQVQVGIFPITAVPQGWLGEITLRSCSSKEVNNQVEVNDRPNEEWRWWPNTTRALDGWLINDHNGYSPVHFFWMSLNSKGKLAHRFTFYFLKSMNCVPKLVTFAFIF